MTRFEDDVHTSLADAPHLFEHERSLSPEEEARLSKTLFAAYRGAQTSWQEEAQEEDDFAFGNHWSADDLETLEDREQAPVAYDITGAAVEQAVAMLTSRKPAFAATARDDLDRKAARLIADCLTWIWEESNGNQELKVAIRDYYAKGGRGVLFAYYDPEGDFGNGEVYFKSLDGFDVYPDPNSTDKLWRDAAHIIVHSVMTGEKMVAVFGDGIRDVLASLPAASEQHGSRSSYRYDDNSGQIGSNVHEVYHKRYDILHRYTRQKKQYVHLRDERGFLRYLSQEDFAAWGSEIGYLVQTERGIVAAHKDEDIQQVAETLASLGLAPTDTATFHYRLSEEAALAAAEQGMEPEPEIAFGVEDPEDPEVMEGSTTRVIPTTRERLVAAGYIEARLVPRYEIDVTITCGEHLLAKGSLPTTEYPVVPILNQWRRTPYTKGDVSRVKSIQQSINKTQSLIIAHTATSSSPKVLVPRGTDIESMKEEFGRPGLSVVEYDPEFGAPVVVAPAPLSSALYQKVTSDVAFVERTLGVYAMQQGDPSAAPDTYGGTMALDEYGLRRLKTKLDDIEASLVQLGKVLVQFVQAYYREEKVFRLVQPSGEETAVAVNQPLYDDFGSVIGRINDITVGRYDVKVVTGSTLPSNRWAMMRYFIEMYEKGLVDQVEVLKKSEVFDVEGVLQRSGQMAQMQQQIAQLEEMVKNLKGDLQTREREVYHAKQETELVQMRAKLKGLYSEQEAAATVYEARTDDALKNTQRDLKTVIEEARREAKHRADLAVEKEKNKPKKTSKTTKS